MTPENWASLTVSILAITTAFITAIRWLVKHYLSELKPNGGSSVSDRINRVESRVDDIYRILCERDK
jgi:hypothetical protein